MTNTALAFAKNFKNTEISSFTMYPRHGQIKLSIHFAIVDERRKPSKVEYLATFKECAEYIQAIVDKETKKYTPVIGVNY